MEINIKGHIVPSRYGNLIFLMKRRQELLSQKKKKKKKYNRHREIPSEPNLSHHKWLWPHLSAVFSFALSSRSELISHSTVVFYKCNSKEVNGP